MAPRRFQRRRPTMCTVSTANALAVRTTEPMFASFPKFSIATCSACLRLSMSAMIASRVQYRYGSTTLRVSPSRGQRRRHHHHHGAAATGRVVAVSACQPVDFEPQQHVATAGERRRVAKSRRVDLGAVGAKRVDARRLEYQACVVLLRRKYAD